MKIRILDTPNNYSQGGKILDKNSLIANLYLFLEGGQLPKPFSYAPIPDVRYNKGGHLAAYGLNMSPDYDPEHIHYHTKDGLKVEITLEDWNKHYGQPYFKEVQDAVEAELKAFPNPEYIINLNFVNDLVESYPRRMPNYLNYKFVGNLPDGYSYLDNGMIQDSNGNLFVLDGFRQSPRFTYDSSKPLLVPVSLNNANKGNVTYYPVNIEKTIKPSLPINSILDIDKKREEAINNMVKYRIPYMGDRGGVEGFLDDYANSILDNQRDENGTWISDDSKRPLLTTDEFNYLIKSIKTDFKKEWGQGEVNRVLKELFEDLEIVKPNKNELNKAVIEVDPLQISDIELLDLKSKGGHLKQGRTNSTINKIYNNSVFDIWRNYQDNKQKYFDLMPIVNALEGPIVLPEATVTDTRLEPLDLNPIDNNIHGELGLKSVPLDLAITGGIALGPLAYKAIASPVGKLLTKQFLASDIGGRSVDLASNLTTGKSVSENAGDAIEGITGWNPNSTMLGLIGTSFFNPGYYLSPPALTNSINKGILAANNLKFNDLIFKYGIKGHAGNNFLIRTNQLGNYRSNLKVRKTVDLIIHNTPELTPELILQLRYAAKNMKYTRGKPFSTLLPINEGMHFPGTSTYLYEIELPKYDEWSITHELGHIVDDLHQGLFSSSNKLTPNYYYDFSIDIPRDRKELFADIFANTYSERLPYDLEKANKGMPWSLKNRVTLTKPLKFKNGFSDIVDTNTGETLKEANKFILDNSTDIVNGNKIVHTLFRDPVITAENMSTITPEEWTFAQDAAIARGDMAEALRLRDLHARINRYDPLHEYHGSNKQFKEFKESESGIYFTPDESAAEEYARGLYPTKYDVYLNLGDDVVTIDNKGLPWNKIPESIASDSFGISKEDLHSLVGAYNPGAQPWYTDFLLPFGFRPKTHYYAIDQLAKVANEQGKTGLKLSNALDNGKKITAIKNKLYDQHVVFKPNLIKSADAVTYDDKGIRIPLGLRDNFNLKDIRYALIPVSLGLYGLQKDIDNRVYKNGGSLSSSTKSKLFEYLEPLAIKDNRGLLNHPGLITKIGSNNITMDNVPYDVLGISDTGDTKLMHSGNNYIYDGSLVVEIPMTYSNSGSTHIKDYYPGFNKYAYGGPKGKRINPTLQQIDLARMRYKGYFDAMVNNSIDPLYASDAAYYATQQSFAEMGWEPNKYNNYGGMKNSKGLISYPSEEAYFNAWVKNANNKWPEYFKSLSIEDWDEALNHTSLGLFNEKLFNAYKEKNPNTYIYAPIWENESYLNKMKGVKNRMDASLGNYHKDYFIDYMIKQDPLNYNYKGNYILKDGAYNYSLGGPKKKLMN